MGNIRPRKLPELLLLIWLRKKAIGLVATAMLLATFLIINQLPDAYESRGVIAISSKNGTEPQVISAQVTNTTQQLTSQTLLESFIYKYAIYPDLKNTDEAVVKMRKAIKTETKLRGYYPEGPESIAISYRHPDQKIAQQVMGELIAIFDHSNATAIKQASEELASVDNESAQVENELHQFINSAQQKNKTVTPPKTVLDPAAVNSQRLTTASAIESLNDKQFGLEQQIVTLKKQITEQQKLVKSKAPTVTANPAQATLQLRKAELEGLLVTYSTQYTEKNPKVIQTRNQLAEVNRQLAAITTTGETESPLASLEARELRDHQRELARLETEAEVTKRELERKKQFLTSLPSVDPSTAFTRTETSPAAPQVQDFSGQTYTNLIDRQKALLVRRESLQRQLTGGTGIFLVVDQPTVSQQPVAPNRNLLKLIGLMMSLGIGLAAALVLEAPQIARLQDERDIDYFLGTPVLAAIPETLTPAESNRSQRLVLARGFLTLVLAALAVPLFYLLLNGIGVFQILGNR